MTSPIGRPVRVLRASAHVAKLERVRRTIPIERYLGLLDGAAQTGQLARLDPNGRPTGEFDTVEGKDRIAIMHKLVDKAMPDRLEPPPLPEDIEAGVAAIDISNMDDDALQALVAAETAKKIHYDSTAPGPERAAPAEGEAGTGAPETDPVHDTIHE